MASTDSIEVYRGQVAELAFTADEDVTDWTVIFTVTALPDSPDKLIQKEGILGADPETGEFSFFLEAVDTDLDPGKYYYDVWRTNENNETPVSVGTFYVRGSSYVPPAE